MIRRRIVAAAWVPLIVGVAAWLALRAVAVDPADCDPRDDSCAVGCP